MFIGNQKLDASSHFQDCLPISSDELIKNLDEWGISYKCFSHVPLNTVVESKRIQSQFLNKDQGGGHIKNLYLRDHKKNNILLVVEQDQKIDLKILKKTLGLGRLSFGSTSRLMDHLGVCPGAVTPFAMITGVKREVSIFLDIELRKCQKIYAHPLVNDRTLEVSVENLEKFFEKIGAVAKWIKF
jgi:Ala-tRNA(Pro) deacylase